MNKLEIFKHSEFGDVRGGVDDKGNPWFVGKDVAVALGYTNPQKALRDHCKGVTKRSPLKTGGGVQELRVINEPDLYRLIARSKLPSAEKFESWIFEEVLPSIRKHGGYIVGQEDMSKAEFLAKAVLMADSVIKEQQLQLESQAKELEEARPKVDYFDGMVEAGTLKKIGEAAKLLHIGPNNLFESLRQAKVLMPGNIPYERYMKTGYFEVKERLVRNGLFEEVKTTTFVTRKGMDWLYEKFVKNKEFPIYSSKTKELVD